MSQAVVLPDELFDRLRHIAEQRGLSIEQLLAQWTAESAPDGGSRTAASQDEDLLVSCTGALLDGGEPPVATDWDEIQKALSASEPIYPAVEEAMSALRRRPWSKDE